MDTSGEPPGSSYGLLSVIYLAVVPVVVLAVSCLTYTYSDRESLDAADAARLADGLAFDKHVFGAEDGGNTQRRVAPEYDNIRSWISAVGAAAALADLDADGQASEICLVDPVDDSVKLYGLQDVAGVSGVGDPVVLSIPPATPVRPFAPMGCVPADLDADGDEDLIVYFWGRPPVLFAGTGQPVDSLSAEDLVGHELTDPTEIWNSTALNVGDIDGDGHLDLLVANYFPDQVSVLDPAGSEIRPTMHESMSAASNGGNNRLLLTTPVAPDRPPAVVDASSTLPPPARTAWTLATGLQDLNGDLLPEIYLANDFGHDHLLENNSSAGRPDFEIVTGDRTWTDPKSKVLGRDSFKGMGVTFSYLDSSYSPTIFVSNITSEHALQESNLVFVPDASAVDEIPEFRDRSEQLGLSRSGWSWDIQAVDLNNDGVDEIAQSTGFLAGDTDRWPELQELAMGNDGLLSRPGVWPRFDTGDDLSGHEPDRLWVRDRSGRYFDVAETVGFGSTVPSRGIAVGDVNRDGLADLVVANQWGPSALYINKTPGVRPAASLRVQLLLPTDRTRTAIGAVLTAPATAGLPAWSRQIYPANGHASTADSRVLIPLGDRNEREINVRWRDHRGEPHQADLVVTADTDLILSTTGEIHTDD